MLFMISLAWKKQRSVIGFCLIIVVTSILLNLTQLYFIPAVLKAVEDNISMIDLLAIILLFTGASLLLKAGNAYFASCSQVGRIEVRLMIGSMIQNKILTMSYPDMENQDVQREMDKASMLVASNTAPTEVIWNTLMALIENGVEFLIFICLLGVLSPLLIWSVLGTTIISFFMRDYLNGWGFRHREEEAEYSHRMNYLSDISRDYTIAKDVRVFGMQDWIEDMYHSTLRLYHRFMTKGERIYMAGDLIDVILTFMRNGIIYFFLISAVLKGEMSAPRFVLYFNTVNAFTSGITKIMSEFSYLRKQSRDISAIREFLDYPETFQMKTGIPISPDLTIPYQIELQDVSFHYPKSRRKILSHINLTIRPGEKLEWSRKNNTDKINMWISGSDRRKSIAK